jgi:multidrug efflux pump subunit AcrA (membrane-fusion protein)
MYSNKRKSSYLLQLILLLSILFIGGCGQNKKEQITNTMLQPPKEEYNTVKATKGDYITTLSSKKVDLVYDAVTVTSDKKSGRFSEYKVIQYDKVMKGEVIAVLDTDISTIDLEEKQLAFQRNQNQYRSECKDRKENLRKQEQALEQMSEGIEKEIATIKLNKARIQLEQFILQNERSLKQQKKDIEKLEKEISDNKILAPFNGFIFSLSPLDKGDKVNPGDAICKLVPEDQICLGVAELGDLRYNMEVTVTSKIGRTEEDYTGRVIHAKNIAPDGTWENMSYIVLEDPIYYLKLQNPSVNAEIMRIKNVLLIDSSLLNSEINDYYVSLYENEQVTKQYVTVGKSSRDKSWILQGLSENQAVIIN